MRILILGGTGEAVELADGLHRAGHRVTTSFAGRTGLETRPRGHVVSGGFGGARGLGAYMVEEQIDALVDATHPFAARISANAIAAAQTCNVPVLRLERPLWAERAGFNWHHVARFEAAAACLPVGSTALLTIGKRHLEPFLARNDCQFVLRAISGPEHPLPGHFDFIAGRPPFDRDDELALMRQRGISHLVTKNSGGAQTYAKIEAAYILKIGVVMIDRPVLPVAASVSSAAAAIDYLEQLPVPSRSFFLPWLRKIWAKPAS